MTFADGPTWPLTYVNTDFISWLSKYAKYFCSQDVKIEIWKGKSGRELQCFRIHYDVNCSLKSKLVELLMKHSNIIFTVRSARISWVKFKFEGYKHMGFKTRTCEISTYVCLPLYEAFRSTYVSIIIDSVVGQENVYHSAGLQKYLRISFASH